MLGGGPDVQVAYRDVDDDADMDAGAAGGAGGGAADFGPGDAHAGGAAAVHEPLDPRIAGFFASPEEAFTAGLAEAQALRRAQDFTGGRLLEMALLKFATDTFMSQGDIDRLVNELRVVARLGGFSPEDVQRLKDGSVLSASETRKKALELAADLGGGCDFQRYPLAVSHKELPVSTGEMYVANLRSWLTAVLQDPSINVPGTLATDLGEATLPDGEYGESRFAPAIVAMARRTKAAAEAAPWFEPLKAHWAARGYEVRVLPVAIAKCADDARAGRQANVGLAPIYAQVLNYTRQARNSSRGIEATAFLHRFPVPDSASNDARAHVRDALHQQFYRAILQQLVEWDRHSSGPLVLDSLPGAPDSLQRQKIKWIIEPFLATVTGDHMGLAELLNMKTNVCRHCLVSVRTARSQASARSLPLCPHAYHVPIPSHPLPPCLAGDVPPAQHRGRAVREPQLPGRVPAVRGARGPHPGAG